MMPLFAAGASGGTNGPIGMAAGGFTPIGSETLLGVVESHSQFSTFARAVKTAGLTQSLKNRSPKTVFVPTNEAFNRLPAKTLNALFKHPARLKAVLLNTMVNGDLYYAATGRRFAAYDLNRRHFVRTRDNVRLPVVTRGSNVIVGGADVVEANLTASNGVIQVVNRVLLPPSKT
jgi:uncharacterized surface protein with fasciclin (FAS1) repeats